MPDLVQASELDITKEWNSLAQVRARQIASGKDVTYSYILLPTLLGLCAPTPNDVCLDAGCGVGVFTAALSKEVKRVVAVDLSRESILQARQVAQPNTEFYVSSVQNYANETADRFDLIVANMVLTTVPDLKSILVSIHSLLRRNSRFVFCIPHPAFWPEYYGYADCSWFNYNQELGVNSEFKITTDPQTGLFSTHFHRPLSAYLNTLVQCDFRIDELVEPLPSEAVASLYPSPWRWPRYLFVRASNSRLQG